MKYASESFMNSERVIYEDGVGMDLPVTYPITDVVNGDVKPLEFCYKILVRCLPTFKGCYIFLHLLL